MAPTANYTNPVQNDAEDDENAGKTYGDLDTGALRKLFIHIGLAVTLFFIWLTFTLFQSPRQYPALTLPKTPGSWLWSLILMLVSVA